VSLDDDQRKRVHDLVTAYLGGQVPPGDLVSEPMAVRSGTAIVYIRLIDGDPCLLRIFSPLLRGVPRGGDLLEELNDLNARLSFLRLFWRDDTVYAAMELLADALTDRALGHAVDTVADAADFYDEFLEPRFGGTKAYADRPGA
jgi:hypothetical protein